MLGMEDSLTQSVQNGEIMPAQDERYADFIIQYVQNINWPMDILATITFQVINETYGVIYVPLDQIGGEPDVNSYAYNATPKCYTFMDLESLAASGVTRLHGHPYLMLRGKGTAVAVIDSGIDYRNPIFRDGGGSRITYLWDQTLIGEPGEAVPYGRLFTKADIDRALESDTPLEVVPSSDTNGHGTAMAGTMAGNIVYGEDFSGAAPEATLIVVKLKPAKNYLREFYLLPADAEVFQEDDIMLGIAYAMKWAKQLYMPLSVALGLGTSQGAHVGLSPLSQYIDYVVSVSQVSIAVAAGNEGAARHHYLGNLSAKSDTATVEIRVGERDKGFIMEWWGQPPVSYAMAVQSPTGEILDISTSLGPVTQELSFVFVETKVMVNYVSIERASGYPLVFFRFLHPAPGIWKVIVRTRDRQNVNFHMWLPVQGLISEETYFLEPSPYNTVTTPGDAQDGITMTAYQYRDNSLYLQAGRGFTPDGLITPDLAAPGVDIRVPLLRDKFGYASGTSLAAAQTAGIAALMFEWALIRENEPFFTGASVKHYLQRGARREQNLQYPNPEWGYGRVDLYHTFELLT